MGERKKVRHQSPIHACHLLPISYSLLSLSSIPNFSLMIAGRKYCIMKLLVMCSLVLMNSSWICCRFSVLLRVVQTDLLPKSVPRFYHTSSAPTLQSSSFAKSSWLESHLEVYHSLSHFTGSCGRAKAEEVLSPAVPSFAHSLNIQEVRTAEWSKIGEEPGAS